MGQYLAVPVPSNIQLLTEYNFNLPSGPINSLEREILQTASFDHPDQTHFVLDSATSPGLLNFLHVRNHHLSPPQNTYGYISSSDASAWGVWAIVDADADATAHDPRTLKITSFGHGRDLKGDVEMLVMITAKQAEEHRCTRITIWGLEGHAKETVIRAVGLGGGKGKVEVVQREEHLGGIAWYGPGEVDEVAWVRVEE